MKLFFVIFFFFYHTQLFANDHFNKVVVIIFENTNYSSAISQPYFAKIAKEGIQFSNFDAEVHPSQGNYVALISGSTFNITNDKNIDLDGNHLGDLLERKGLSWRVYAEDYPGNCFTGEKSKKYVRKHIPFISFKNVSQNSERCKNIENESRFFEDFKSNNLASFNLYIPNIQNDGHDTGVNYAGKWLETTFGKYFANPDSLGDTLFILTFDESGSSARNQIYTAILGKDVVPNSVDGTSLNHYSILKFIEDQFSLGNLGRNDTSAVPIKINWK